MTETLERPSRPSLPPRRIPGGSARATAVSGALAALTTAATGLLAVVLPVLLLWAADGRAGAAFVDALRTAGQLWLVAHGASVEVPGGTYGLTPLGLLALPAWLLWRSARRAAVEDEGPRAVVRRVAATALAYGLVAALVAVLAVTDDVRARPLPVLLWAGALALVAGLAGGLRPVLTGRLRRLVGATATAVGVLLGAGALLAGLALALDLPRAADLAAAGDPGPVGGVGLLLVGLALVPNAVVLGLSWLAGPGFAVGAGTSVTPTGGELGPVPALPLLAALPDGAAPAWAVVALLVPLVAGALAGLLVARDLPGERAGRTALEAALVGPAAGLVCGLLAWLAGGPAGGERLAEVGPAPVPVALAVTLAVGVGSVLAASVARYRSRD